MKITILAVLIFFVLVIGAGGQTPKPSPTPTPETVFGPEFKRWVDIDTFNLITRYRYVRANNTTTIANQTHWQIAVRTRFKFDKAGKYSVNAGVFTGPQFITNFNNLGPGTGKLQTNVFVKHLFFDARPTKKIEVQIGGITINNGENSEATGYDNDGFLTGERVVVRAPKKLFFDEISATNAYLGDLMHPSIFGRLHRLNEANYHQFMVRKQITKEVGFSSDYTFASGTDTVRGAVRIKPKHFFLDLLLVDAYERVSTPKGFGIDFLAAKVLHRRFTLSGGFVRIDRRLTLNADRFPPGKRLYAAGVVTVTHELTLTPVLIHGVGRLATPTTHRTRLDIIFTWSVLETLHRHHVL